MPRGEIFQQPFHFLLGWKWPERVKKAITTTQKELRTMTNLVNHPGFWLREDAAASLARLEAAHGKISINSAGRTVNEQEALLARWRKGGSGNRPPNLYQPQSPASKSNHVKDGGRAVDTNHQSHMLKFGAEFGWTRPYAGDPPHFEYDPSKDRHRNVVGSGHGVTSSDEVKRQQDWVNRYRGEKLAVDGKLGPATKAAFARYQTFLRTYNYRQAIDGVWGPGMQAAHSAYVAVVNRPAPAAGGRPTLRKGASGADVLVLQDRLNGRYPAYSKLARDSQFGPSVERVVKEFQKRSGLVADGVVGGRTWKALGL
jgi:peptidoglycan hydrolase-like protein with peptidoglycan-binding domain